MSGAGEALKVMGNANGDFVRQEQERAHHRGEECAGNYRKDRGAPFQVRVLRLRAVDDHNGGADHVAGALLSTWAFRHARLRSHATNRERPQRLRTGLLGDSTQAGHTARAHSNPPQ